MDKRSKAISAWINEIDAAKRREKNFRKDGERILQIYGADDPEMTPFNILYSNTETLLPALYSAVPRPVVQRRFKDEDPIGKAASEAGMRVLEFLVDTNIDGYETYDEGMRAAVLDGLLPGRGVTGIKYDAELADMKAELPDEDPEEPDQYKKSELVCIESRSWNRVYFGYAKKWSKVPWIAYEEHIDRAEADRLFGKAVASKLKFQKNDSNDEKEGSGGNGFEDRDQGERKTVCIYQIWDKDGGRKVRYVNSEYPEFLKVQDDPLELTGFFNCPKPIMFMEKSNDMKPTALYMLYENQAKELNRLTIRINKIVDAIKARGIYDSELGDDIAQLFEEGDNALVPADKSSSLAAEKGLQNAIWFMPIEKLIETLTQLNMAREQCKRVIYEVTGISDIIRGSTVASETATAQNLKSQWGNLRLKRLQKEVQRYARDLLRMMLEIAATKFSAETWARMTGLPFLLDAKVNELTAITQALQGQIGMAQAAQQPPQPELVQQLQKVQQELQTPKWSDVLSTLRDDTQRAYRIDIETNSTVEPEATEDQKNIADVMNALAQYLNGVAPLVAKGSMPWEAAQAMMLAIVRRFRFGPEIEDYVKAMKAPQPEGAGDAEAKKAEMQQAQAEKKAELDQQAMIEQGKAQRESQAEQNRAAEKMAELETEKAIETMRLQSTAEMESQKLEFERRSQQAKLQNERAIAEMKAQYEQDTELKKAALMGAVQVQTASISADQQRESAAMQGQENERTQAAEAGNQDAMNAILATQTELLKLIAAPKQIERDKKGKATLRIMQ